MPDAASRDFRFSSLFFVFGALWLLAEIFALDAVLASGRDLGGPTEGFLPLSAALGWRIGAGPAFVLVPVFAVLAWCALRGLAGRARLALIPAVIGFAVVLAPTSAFLWAWWVLAAIVLPVALCLVATVLGRLPTRAPSLPSPGAAADARAAGTGAMNQLAIAALVVVFVNSLVGAILGHVALGQIARTGQEGRGLAVAAIAVGWSSVGLTVVLLVVAVLIQAI